MQKIGVAIEFSAYKDQKNLWRNCGAPKELISKWELKHGQKLPAERNWPNHWELAGPGSRSLDRFSPYSGYSTGEGTFIRETSVSLPLTMILEMEQNSISQLMEVRRV